MADERQHGEYQALEDARAKIDQQAAEIERLRQQVAENRFAEHLREALAVAATAGNLAEPEAESDVLRLIVETAVQVIRAKAGSLLRLEPGTSELVFEVATGPVADEVKKIRVPLGHGLAGLVAQTGEPLMSSDTARDNRDAADIAQAVGYVPEDILCYPLVHGDRVIGVIELLDKEGTPTARDMQLLGLFARLGAVAIVERRARRNLAALVAEAVASLGELPEPQRRALLDQARTIGQGGLAPEHQRALEIAGLLREIGQHGEAELEACRAIVRDFASYLRMRSVALGGPELLR